MQNAQDEGFFREPQGSGEQAAVSRPAPPPVPTTPIDDAIDRNRPRLLEIDGVIGVAHGRTSLGADAVLVHVVDESVRADVPAEIEDFPVEVIVVEGGFRAQ
jgi:hypothetical protein